LSFYFFITFLYIYHILGLQGDRIEEADTPFERLFFILFLFIYYIFGLLGDRIEEADTPFEPLFFILFLFIYYIFGLLGDRIEEAVTPLELFHLGLPELNIGVLSIFIFIFFRTGLRTWRRGAFSKAVLKPFEH
jgi:hypothetical protein